MIVRILSEGQFEIKDDGVRRLNELDAEIERALESHDRSAFQDVLTRMVEYVREHGTPLPADSLLPSDAVLPSADTSAEELRNMLKEEGLIPGT
jgi:hypothetical protein